MKALMIQGTSSSAGKSLVTAGICRYFSRNGRKVAPFKAQNMSLNSYVVDGGEMAWAQVVQAWAAGAWPSLDFNPVLLKPTGEAGSQVILAGKAVKVMQARDYHFGFYEEAKQAVNSALDRLKNSYDLVVMEGAGSSAEINLLDFDLANWHAAEQSDAKIVLVADIERGGTFASIYGSLMLLPEEKRKRIAGWIINKFRGDKSVLDPAIKQIETLTGIPCLGILPYLSDLELPPEDSLDLKDHRGGHPLIIGIIRLPSISNFTDFQPLYRWADVKYISHPSESQGLDMLLIPGSKNTVFDLEWLHAREWPAALRRESATMPVLGICGGYQMLGEWIYDEQKNSRQIPGVNLLPVATRFSDKKDLFQVQAEAKMEWMGFRGNGLCGYEIHTGKTELASPGPSWLELIRHPGGKLIADGSVSSLTAGTHMHGLFHNERFSLHLANVLRMKKGLSELDSLQPMEDIYQTSLERLADYLEKHIDMTAIEEIL